MAGCMTTERKSGDFFLNFTTKIRKTRVEEIFNTIGVKGFTIDTFLNDAGTGASMAVKSILEKKNKPGYEIFEQGEQPVDIKRRLHSEKGHDDDLMTEEEIDEKTFKILSQSIGKCDSRMEEMQEQVEGVSNKLSELNVNLEKEVKTKEAIIQKLSKELDARNKELSDRNRELQERKTSQRITFEDLGRSELECSRLRQENSRLYAEMTAQNHLAFIRNELQEVRELQHRQFRATTEQNNFRFRILWDALGLRARNPDSMDL